MNFYGFTLSALVALLIFLFYLKSGLRRKLLQRTWIERIETIARENHFLWSTQLPYYHNSKLSEELLKIEEKQRKEGIVLQMSNQGGWHSQSDILKYPLVKKLFRRLMPHIESYAQMMGLDSRYLTITAWANINRDNHANALHTHDDALFSGCYYLKGDSGREISNGGISFYKKGEDKRLMATFSPESGDFLLFPSDMSHSVHPYQGSSERISIAFNVHFGNRKKSWLVSKMQNLESVQKLDPYYELSGQKNAPKYADESSERKSMLFHTSKIKKKFTK